MAELLAGGAERLDGPRRGRGPVAHRRRRTPARRRRSCSPRSRGPARSSRSVATTASTPTRRASTARRRRSIFAKWPSSVVGHGAEIRWDPGLTTQVDYEAELAVVIGRPARACRRGRGPRLRPRLHLPQRRVGSRPPVRRRPVGPRQVARHVLPDGPGARHRRTRSPIRRRSRSAAAVGGEVVQDANTSQMYFGVAAIISYCSQSFTPRAGRRDRDRDARRASASSATRRASSATATQCRSRSRASAGSTTSAASTAPAVARHDGPPRRAVPRHRRARLHRRVDGPGARPRGRPGRRLRPRRRPRAGSRQIMTDDELAAVDVRRRRHHRPRRRRARARRRTGSRTSSTSPPSRSRSAGPTRRSARSSTSSGPSTSSRPSSAGPADGAARLHELDRDVRGGRRRPGDAAGSRRTATAPPANHYGVYKLANEGNARVYWLDDGHRRASACAR